MNYLLFCITEMLKTLQNGDLVDIGYTAKFSVRETDIFFCQAIEVLIKTLKSEPKYTGSIQEEHPTSNREGVKIIMETQSITIYSQVSLIEKDILGFLTEQIGKVSS